MKSKEELLQALSGNEVLLKRLEEAWKSGASDETIGALLADAGIQLDADDLQEFLAMRQKSKLETVGRQPVDEDQLDAVVGGGDGICDGKADCDFYFRQYTKVSKDDRCIAFSLCDESFRTDCAFDVIEMTYFGNDWDN